MRIADDRFGGRFATKAGTLRISKLTRKLMSQITPGTGLLSHPQYWRWLQMLMCLQIRRFLLWIEQHVCSGDAFLVPAKRRRLDRAVGFIESGFCITRESGAVL